jgi:hypothetical protein
MFLYVKRRRKSQAITGLNYFVNLLVHNILPILTEYMLYFKKQSLQTLYFIFIFYRRIPIQSIFLKATWMLSLIFEGACNGLYLNISKAICTTCIAVTRRPGNSIKKCTHNSRCYVLCAETPLPVLHLSVLIISFDFIKPVYDCFSS